MGALACPSLSLLILGGKSMNSPAVSREFSPQRFPRQKLVARRVRLGPPEPLEVRLLGHHAVQVLVQRVEQHLGVAVKKDIFL